MIKKKKVQMQEIAEKFATMCLKNGEEYHQYSDKDLVNATLIFIHFFMDIIWRTNQHLSFKKQCAIAKYTGQGLRELIKSATGKDLKKIIK